MKERQPFELMGSIMSHLYNDMLLSCGNSLKYRYKNPDPLMGAAHSALDDVWELMVTNNIITIVQKDNTFSYKPS